MKMKRFLLVVFSLLLLLAFMGCSDDTNNSSVTNPNPAPFYPKGYVQGKVYDSCTNQPIAGAVIDIGVAKAVTDNNGQYMMSNVPATTYIDHTVGGSADVELKWDPRDPGQGGLFLSEADLKLLLEGSTSGWVGVYSATIDMSKAKVVVDVNSATGQAMGLKTTTQVPVTTAPLKYANKYYNVVSVAFSSLKESDGNVPTMSNHDTQVSQLGNGNFDFWIGQLTSGISGDAIWGATYDAATGKIALKPVANYPVALYTVLGEENFGNSATGIMGHRVAVTTTDANGHFAFANLETRHAYIIAVVDSATSAAKYAGYTLAHTMCDRDILTFNIQDGKAINVFSTDVVCPFIQMATVDGQGPNADVSKEALADGVDIVLTFSEPIKKTNLNTGRALLGTTDYLSDAPANVTPLPKTLYHDIAVNFLGFKASNVPHTLAWNESMTQLTIHIDAQYLQPASAYAVQILNGQNLKDENGNVLTNGIGKQIPVSSLLPNQSDVNNPYSLPGGGNSLVYKCADEISAGNWGFFFTTYGVIPASKVSDLKVMPVTPKSGIAQLPYELDYNDKAKLDWTAVLGAKSYNLYCRLIQWNECRKQECAPDICTAQYHPFVLVDNVLDTHYFTNFQGVVGRNYKTGEIACTPVGVGACKPGFFKVLYNMDEENWEFVERDYIKLGYECYVKGVDADAIEGVQSNVVLIEDSVNPKIASITGIAAGASFAKGGSFEVCFSEPMNELSVENAGWVLNPLAFSNAFTYDIDYYTTDTKFCAKFVFNNAVNVIANVHTTSANVLALVSTNITVLSLGTTGTIMTDVAGNPLVILPGQLPVNITVPYVSP